MIMTHITAPQTHGKLKKALKNFCICACLASFGLGLSIKTQSKQNPIPSPGNGAFAHEEVQIITTAGTHHLKANPMGRFQHLTVGANEKVAVVVSCPSGTRGDPISLEAEDGGTIDGKMSTILPLNQDLVVRFTFNVGSLDGVYRIRVRSGESYRTLFFWVGQQT